MRTHTLCALAATAALLALAACGGSNTSGTPAGGDKTPAQLAAEATTALDAARDAVNNVMNDSDEAKVSAANTALAAAKTKVEAAAGADNHADLKTRLTGLETLLAGKKSARVTALIKAANDAVKAVMNDSDNDTVTAANTALMKAKEAADADDAQKRQLTQLEGRLMQKKEDRMAAMKAEADRMKAEALAVYTGIAPYSDVTDNVARRYAVFSDQGVDLDLSDATLNVTVGELDTVNLERDKGAMVTAPAGWTGAKYTLTDEGTTYEAMVYDNRYSAPGRPFRVAWKDELTDDGILPGANVNAAEGIMLDVELAAGPNLLAPADETYKVRGTFTGVPGEFFCKPAAGRACAARLSAEEGSEVGLGDSNASLQFAFTNGWTFKPDNVNDRVIPDPDVAFISYGYWIKKSASGKWDVSAFHHAYRGALPSFSGLDGDDNLGGTATYTGGAAGVYALSAEAGTFTADAELVADFTNNKVTGTIDGFMTERFTGGGDAMARGWSVELHQQAVGDGGGMEPDTSSGSTGLTRWTVDGTAAPASGKWEGAFYGRGGKGLRPKAATGSFYAEHGMNGRMVGAFGVLDPDRDEQ